jgi:chromosome segregation ATPase
MTDLVSLTDIATQLQQLAETRLPLADAYRIAQQTQATYEADRAAKDATIDNLTQQVTTLTNQTQAQGVTLANLTTDKAVLTDSVNSLNTQVASLTQQVNTLIAQTQAQIVAIGNLTTDKAALTNTVNSLTAQVATLTQSNTRQGHRDNRRQRHHCRFARASNRPLA